MNRLSLVLVASAVILIVGVRGRVRLIQLQAALESTTPPAIAEATKAFEASSAQAHAAEKQLEEVEDNVPGWMTQFPPSLLKDTVTALEHPSPPTPSAPSAPSLHSAAVSEEQGRGGSRSGGGGGAAREGERREPSGSGAKAALGSAKSISGTKKTQQERAERMQADMGSDPKLAGMAEALARALSKARTLEHAAAHSEDLAHEAASSAAGTSSKLSMREKSELGSLFNLNTVLAKVSRAKKRAFDIAVGQAKKHVYGSAEDAVVSQADLSRGAAAAPEQRKAYIKKKAAERAARLHAAEQLKEKDLAEAESKAAMRHAAAILLRQLHGNRDRWLKGTLEKIAGDVAAVNAGHSRIQHMSKSIEAQERALARRRGRHADASDRSGRDKSSDRSVLDGGTPSLKEALKQPESERQQTEATRLLQHMLKMAHSDFRHMNKREANVLDTEAKDGKLMRETGAAAVKSYERRQHWQERHQAMLNAADETAAKDSSRAMQISSPQAVLQVARGAGRAGGGGEKTRDAKSSWVGQLGSDLMKDVGF